MFEYSTIILLDNSLKMHGCNSDNYRLAGEYLMSMAVDSKFVPQLNFSSLTIIRNSEVYKIKDKQGFIDRVKFLSDDLSVALYDQVPIWKNVVNRITDKYTNVYILTSRVEKTVADWFSDQFVNVQIIDMSKKVAEKSKDWFNVYQQEKKSIHDVAKHEKMQQVDLNNTVLDFGIYCIGDSPLQCLNTKNDEKIPIQNIRIYGTAAISIFDEFPISAIGKFRPSFDTMYSIPENFEKSGSKIPRVPKSFNNLEIFNNIFHTMDSMTIESDEIVAFFGKAYCRETKTFFPVLLKTSSNYVPRVQQVSVEESDEDINEDSFISDEDDNLSLDGWGEEESGRKRGPRYFEVKVLETSWEEFKSFAKIRQLLLSNDELYDLDEMYPGLVYYGNVLHYSAKSMSVTFYRMIRALRELPERTVIYQKEAETMCKMILMSQSKSYCLLISRLLLRASDHLSKKHKHIAYETAKHFMSLPIEFNYTPAFGSSQYLFPMYIFQLLQ